MQDPSFYTVRENVSLCVASPRPLTTFCEHVRLPAAQQFRSLLLYFSFHNATKVFSIAFSLCYYRAMLL